MTDPITTRKRKRTLCALGLVLAILASKITRRVVFLARQSLGQTSLVDFEVGVPGHLNLEEEVSGPDCCCINPPGNGNHVVVIAHQEVTGEINR